MKKLLYIFIALLLALDALDVRAQDTYTLLEPLPCIEGTGNNCNPNELIQKIEFNTYLSYIFKFGIAIAGFLAVVMIIVGGFEYMLSEAPFAKTNGKERITNAIIGLLGVLTSYLILVTIDPRLVQINSALPPIEIKTDEAAAFRQNLGQELSLLNEASRLEYVRLTSTMTDKKKAIEALETKEGGPGLTAQEKLDLIKLKEEVRGITADRTKVLAHETLEMNFSQAIGKINALESASITDTQKEIAGEVTKINLTTAKYVDQLHVAGDLEGEAQLANKKVFYMEQLTEQISLMTSIAAYEDKPQASGKTVLENYMKIYENELDNLEDSTGKYADQMKDDSTLSLQYGTLLQNRIGLIKATLKIQ
ncbi:MAG: pilin [Patescibacteria group bacterium]